MATSATEKLREIYKQLGVEVFNKQSQYPEAIKEIERLQRFEANYKDADILSSFSNRFNDSEDDEEYEDDDYF